MERLTRISERTSRGYWRERILSEIDFVRRLSQVSDGVFDGEVTAAVDILERGVTADGAVGRSLAQEAESALQPASGRAKSFELLCASHAHIDMNWMWGWQETVTVTLETFRTVLTLMDEYPDFTFSQSQASVYRIVEEYEPSMLDSIRMRVAEGRWEVTASQWVEGDKNLPGGEALVRHLLYSRKYLSDLLGIPGERLNIDFEPDTFGHNANMPEILSAGGVRYYYHCRGSNDHVGYRWFAPSGASIVVYQEPRWYNSTVLPNLPEFVPGFCSSHGIDTALAVYGVGDHGGGPTRRDIERIIEMASWPLFPRIRFGTYREFFEELEKARLPEVRGERNFIFTGCYTSQTRIKMANRLAESGLAEAERYAATADSMGLCVYPFKKLEGAWRDTLFNHFHDILPGSGVTETREYALGKFQESMATALSTKAAALRAIASEIDVTPLIAGEAADDDAFYTNPAEGGGVGFGASGYRITAVERGRGESRAYCIFNPAPRPRGGSVEITVWDWPEKAGMEVMDETGLSLPFQILEAGAGSYWGHTFAKILVGVGIDGLGYRTIVVKRAFGRSDDYLDNPWRHPSNLTHPPVEPVLENDELRAEFHLRELRLVSLIDKKTGRELVSDQKGGAVFRLLTEEADKTWTAWVVGRIIGTKELVDGACLTGKHLEPGALVQWLEYRLAFEASELTVRFELVRGESAVRVKVRCAFRELGDMKRGVPQLDFRLALAEPSAEYHYDIPFGTITRGPIMHDVPAVSWMAAEVGDGSRIMLITRTKNSFRGDGESMAIPLIRGTTNPDPYPEVGTHDIEFAVSVVRERTGAALADTAEDYLLPFSAVSTSASGGSLPPRGSFLTIESAGIRIASIKNAEDESGMILRLFETEGTAGTAEIRLGSPVKGAEWVDAHEHPEKDQGDIAVSGNTVTAALGPFRMRSVKLVPAV